MTDAMSQGQIKICQSTAHIRLIFDTNSSDALICHNLRDTRSLNVHNLDLDGPRSILNMQTENSCATCLMAITMFALSVTILDIFAVEICMTSTFRIG